MKIKQCFQRKTMSPNHILSLELILEMRWGTPKHCNLLVCLNENLGQGHQNLITYLSLDTIMWLVKIHTLVQYKNRLQTRLLIAWWPWTLVKITEILSLLSPIPMYLWQICQNPCIGSLDIMQIRLIFTVLIMWWPWKLGQGHQILINCLFIYLSQWYNTWSLVWIHHLVQELWCRQAFVEWKFDIQNTDVTLKMRPRSPKSNHFFLLYQTYFYASLVKIHLLVQEIECRQGSFWQSL